jgi:hypothetical protein
MARVKDWLLEDERIKQERAEAAYFALPEAQAKALEGIQDILRSHTELVEQNLDLKAQLSQLQVTFASATGPAARWKERGIGFTLGCLASVLASVIWWRITKQWPLFG